MEDEGRHAVLDDADVPPAPWRGVADRRPTLDARDRRCGTAGERGLRCSGDRSVDPQTGVVGVAGTSRTPGFPRLPRSPGDAGADPLYRSAGSRPAEPGDATPVG